MKIKQKINDFIVSGYNIKIYKARRKARAEKMIALTQLFVSTAQAVTKTIAENPWYAEIALEIIKDMHESRWKLIAWQPLPGKNSKNKQSFIVPSNMGETIIPVKPNIKNINNNKNINIYIDGEEIGKALKRY